ncbi:hypothetical protein ACIQPQ_34575 [Streptomyces sp. NPDC091281]|uniref:hypothetical protein n=1 Tax=Streptomyces sp. NPDC091281 TaxID=3365985 RepID=UPI003824400C
MFDERQVTLAFRQYTLQFAVDEDLLVDLDVAARSEALFGRALLQLKARVLTDELPPERLTTSTRVPYEVPASTWQIWKKRHARRWYARRMVARWPVRYEPDPDGRGADAVCTFDLTRFRTYPRARVALPRRQFGVAVLDHSVRDVRWAGKDTGRDA